MWVHPPNYIILNSLLYIREKISKQDESQNCLCSGASGFSAGCLLKVCILDLTKAFKCSLSPSGCTVQSSAPEHRQAAHAFPSSLAGGPGMNCQRFPLEESCPHPPPPRNSLALLLTQCNYGGKNAPQQLFKIPCERGCEHPVILFFLSLAGASESRGRKAL